MQALETVAGYVVRNPLSLQRLVYLDGQQAVIYKGLKHNPTLGLNFESMDPREWRARMADHIPDPGRHRTLFYAYYANRVRGDRAALESGEPTVEEHPARSSLTSASARPRPPSPRRRYARSCACRSTRRARRSRRPKGHGHAGHGNSLDRLSRRSVAYLPDDGLWREDASRRTGDRDRRSRGGLRTAAMLPALSAAPPEAPHRGVPVGAVKASAYSLVRTHRRR